MHAIRSLSRSRPAEMAAYLTRHQTLGNSLACRHTWQRMNTRRSLTDVADPPGGRESFERFEELAGRRGFSGRHVSRGEEKPRVSPSRRERNLRETKEGRRKVEFSCFRGTREIGDERGERRSGRRENSGGRIGGRREQRVE